MKVYKFGGGVLKDDQALKKMSEIIALQQRDDLLIVVSAFGRTTRKLESVLADYYERGFFSESDLSELENEHLLLINEAGLQDNASLQLIVKEIFIELQKIFSAGLSNDKYFEYDRIVSAGELLSGQIVTAFLNEQGLNAKFVNSADLLVSDAGFGDAKILWEATQSRIRQAELFEQADLIVSQGFTAKTEQGETTTLGREGSDYTAAVFAYCLNADEVVFWKNVPGILNADPEICEDARLLARLSYKEAVEQTFYGAKILHPKTIKPLQNKKIPLCVRPFCDLSQAGTFISEISPDAKEFYPTVPIYIEKNDQILFSVSATDFSFIAEDSLSRIFALLAKYRLKVSVMQNSAISFSFCVGNVKERVPMFIDEMRRHYRVLYNDDLSLITIRHYTDEAIESRIKDKDVLLRQLSRYTARFVVRNGSKPSVFRYDFIGQNRSNLDN